MKHELWKDLNGYTFCLAGLLGNQARETLEEESKLIWTVKASSHFEAMTKYYEFMNWGEYKTDFEQDKEPYSEEWIKTQR